jgi:energy-coupling factor transport system permease protein
MHRLNPFTKLSILLVVSLIAWLNANIVWMLLLIVLTLTLFKLARVPFGSLKRIWAAAFLTIQTAAISYILASRIPGNVLWYTFPWGTYISDLTVIFALTISMRYFAFMVVGTLFGATTRDRDIVYMIRRVHLPYAIGFMVSLGFRTMSTFIGDFITMREAQTGKGKDFTKGNPISRARKYIDLFTPLAVMSIRRMMEISNAVESKGFRSRGKREYYYQVPTSHLDIGIRVSMIALLIVVFVSNFYIKYLSFRSWPLA